MKKIFKQKLDNNQKLEGKAQKSKQNETQKEISSFAKKDSYQTNVREKDDST